jgi:hypothetical protein
VISIVVLALSVVLATVALRMQTTPRRGGSTLCLAISAVPLLLTVALPALFVSAVGGTTGWPRETVAIISRVGIALSLVFLVIGAVLTLRAVLAGDCRAAVVLAIETALAGLPAGIVTAYATVFRLR